MLTDQLIALKDFCGYHNIEYNFVYSLYEAELFEVTAIDEEIYIHSDHIALLEKMVHLHLDLGINSEGIESIFHLLKKIDDLQDRIKFLQQKMEFYENE